MSGNVTSIYEHVGTASAERSAAQIAFEDLAPEVVDLPIVQASTYATREDFAKLQRLSKADLGVLRRLMQQWYKGELSTSLQLRRLFLVPIEDSTSPVVHPWEITGLVYGGGATFFATRYEDSDGLVHTGDSIIVSNVVNDNGNSSYELTFLPEDLIVVEA